MSAEKYENQKYLAGCAAVQRAMAQLREHYESVDITCIYTDSAGVSVTVQQEWSEDDDDEDDDKKIGS